LENCLNHVLKGGDSNGKWNGNFGKTTFESGL
jgi:hypothetical protein